MWELGDYEAVGRLLTSAGEACVRDARVGPGDDVLDVACGTGNATIPAARTGPGQLFATVGRHVPGEGDAPTRWGTEAACSSCSGPRRSRAGSCASSSPPPRPRSGSTSARSGR